MIISIGELSKVRQKNKDKTIVFAGGVFDVFHTSHVRTFKKLRTYGDIVVIGIVSDARVKERKGPNRPVLSQKERREIVDAIKYVDFVVQMPDPTTSEPIPTMLILKKLSPDIFVSVEKNWMKYRQEIKTLGVRLKIVKRIHPISSTSIIERVLEKYIGNSASGIIHS